MIKRCAKCGDVKPLSDFHSQPGGPQGRHSWCKPCANTYARANKKRNYSTEQKRRWLLKTRYGLSQSAVDLLHSEQGGGCGICGKALGRKFHIDHNHVTKKVRGLLCHRCNLLIGGLDDLAIRIRAIAWLERG